MSVEVVLPGVLAADADGQQRLLVDVPPGADVAALLDDVAARHPRLGRRIRDEAGAVRKHVNLFLDGDNVKDTGGLATAVADGATLLVLPNVSGG